MEKSEAEIIHIVVNKLEEALKQTGLRIKIEDRWKTVNSMSIFDIVIYKGAIPLVLIEIKKSIDSNIFLSQAIEQVRKGMSITNSRFGVVSDSERFYFYDRINKESNFTLSSFEEIVNQIIKPERIKVLKKDKEIVLKIIIEAANKYLYENKDFLSYLKNKTFYNKIIFDNNSSSFHFSEDESGINSFENQFFIKMFGEFKDTKICRYTTLNTLYEMLKNISFRMSGLVGMNDKSEVNYVELYFEKENNKTLVEKPLNKEHHNTISAINNRYITSCSKIIRKDDLTLWRLYSDDAKGVCLVFNVKKDNLNNHVLLQKVKYADEYGNHKELDFIKEIIDKVEIKTGFKFEFKKLGVWKHFFKAYDYSIEEEVRLLIIDNKSLSELKKDWVMTYTHSIFNPVIDFRLNSKLFPIHLKEIILGPKCPEYEINQVQIKEMVRRKKRDITEQNLDSNLEDLKIELSSIKHYR